MPSCRITNYTSRPLNVSLKHLCALHFENEVAPGATIKLKPGRVWFTLEVLVDDGQNRYSAVQSAAAIAIVSLAAVGAAAAVPVALASTSAATVSSVVVAGGTGLAAVGDAVFASVGTICTVGKGFLTAHAATAVKLTTAFIPKAVEIVEKEVGGFTAVQKEVISILSSPTVAADVRENGFSILQRLGLAVAADRAAAEEKERQDQQQQPTVGAPCPAKQSKDVNAITNDNESSTKLDSKPSLKRVQTSVSTLMHRISEEGRAERKATLQAKREAKEHASWEVLNFDEKGDHAGMLSTKEQLRIHGLFMNERRHFEVREKDGKLVLMDANTREIVFGSL
ncbi:hypothetical protein FRC20_003241 [Serendipita sp. 405]|nr:hypothetical protein FRC16_003149 [Serendipita sp. 398]KAG8868517.1 hypothetical protein FRC20_003241 [Serendipita sp. 405]